MLEFFISYKKAFIDILTIWLLAVVMPGPDMFLVMTSSIQKGKKYAISSVFGIVAGTFVWLIVGFFLIGFLAKTSFFSWVRIFGGCYLIYMAIKILMSLKNQRSSVNFQDHQEICEDAKKGFFRGFLTNLSNPKAPIFVSVVLTPLPSSIPLGNTLILFFLMLIIPMLWFICVVYFFRIKKILQIFLRYSIGLDILAIFIFGSVGIGLLVE